MKGSSDRTSTALTDEGEMNGFASFFQLRDFHEKDLLIFFYNQSLTLVLKFLKESEEMITIRLLSYKNSSKSTKIRVYSTGATGSNVEWFSAIVPSMLWSLLANLHG